MTDLRKRRATATANRRPSKTPKAQQLIAQLSSRLRARTGTRTGRGRPSDPAWRVRRCVPFTERTWKALQAVSRAMASQGGKFTPAQVAAVMIEDELERTLGHAGDSPVIRLSSRDSELLERASSKALPKKLTQALADLEADIRAGRIVVNV